VKPQKLIAVNAVNPRVYSFHMVFRIRYILYY
jgi:hypothetical protein